MMRINHHASYVDQRKFHIDSLMVEHDAVTRSRFEAITRFYIDIVAAKSPG